uniref:Uncharacterized protein n=1 Tax=Amazona collaria TaxID=241587 RepID=A0A8B9FWH4_9PSIT
LLTDSLFVSNLLGLSGSSCFLQPIRTLLRSAERMRRWFAESGSRVRSSVGDSRDRESSMRTVTVGSLSWGVKRFPTSSTTSQPQASHPNLNNRSDSAPRAACGEGKPRFNVGLAWRCWRCLLSPLTQQEA